MDITDIQEKHFLNTCAYRLLQIEKIQDRQSEKAVRAEGNAKIKLISGDGVESNYMDISWSELCAIKNILTIEPLT